MSLHSKFDFLCILMVCLLNKIASAVINYLQITPLGVYLKKVELVQGVYP